MIEFIHVSKDYNSPDETVVHALTDVSITFPDYGLVTIVGNSGSGKTTLLNILGGLDGQTEGDVFVNGKNIALFSENEWEGYRADVVGTVFQNYELLDDFSARDNIALPLILMGVDKVEAIQRAETLLESFELEDVSSKKVKHLSGGQKQRVAVLRAAGKKPSIILADEPTGNLDKRNSELVFETLRNLAKDCLVIIVTHDIGLSKKYSDLIVQLEYGRIVGLDVIEACQKRNVETAEEPRKTKKAFHIGVCVDLAASMMKKRLPRMIISVVILAISFSFVFLLCALCFRSEKKSLTIFIKNYGEGDKILILYEPLDPSVSGYVNDPKKHIDKGKNLSETVRKEVESQSVIRWKEVGLSVGTKSYFARLLSMDLSLISDKLTRGRMPENDMQILVNESLFGDAFSGDSFPISATIDGMDLEICGCYSDYSFIGIYEKAVLIGSNALLNDLRLFSPYSNGIDVVSERGPLYAASAETSFVASGDEDLVLIDGRMPMKSGEIAVSQHYLESSELSIESVMGKKYELYDFRNRRYGNAYDDVPNFAKELMAKMEVVGVVDSDADFCFDDKTFLEMMAIIIPYKEGTGVLARNGQEKRIVKEIQKSRVRIEDERLEKLYELWDKINEAKPVLLLLILVFIILVAMQMISFFSYGIKDNRHMIGTFRSLGVPKNNLCQIFMMESMLVSLTSLLISVLSSIGLIMCVNNYMHNSEGLSMELKLIAIDPVVFSVVIILTLLFSGLIVLIPIRKFRKKSVVSLLINED